MQAPDSHVTLILSWRMATKNSEPQVWTDKHSNTVSPFPHNMTLPSILLGNLIVLHSPGQRHHPLFDEKLSHEVGHRATKNVQCCRAWARAPTLLWVFGTPEHSVTAGPILRLRGTPRMGWNAVHFWVLRCRACSTLGSFAGCLRT